MDSSHPTFHLMRAMELTEHDLEINRAGKLSARQKQRIASPIPDAVEQIAGIITKEAFRAEKRQLYSVVCADRRVMVSRALYHVFLDHKRHILYLASGELVAAEFDDTADYADDRLREILQFNADDLELNRKRLLSPAQFKKYRNRNNIFLVVIASLFTATSFLLGSVDDQDFFALQMRVILAIIIFMIVVALYVALKARRALSASSVVSIQGIVTKSDPNLTEIDLYDIAVNGDRVFRMGEKAAAFILGETYTIYYIPYRTFFFDHFDPVVSARYEPQESVE